MLSRGGWVLSSLAGLSVALLAPSLPTAIGDLQGPSFPEALLALGSLVQLTVSVWVVLIVALTLVHAPGPVLRAVAPPLLRRALFAGAAGALVLGPAHADPQSAPSRSTTHDLVGLRLPDRPVTGVVPATNRSATVVVRPGDTLWAIAARSLPADADDAAIARACARWHGANRDVIGADPHLIFPMQRLITPLGKDPT